jgi:hypothetical protein
MILPAIILTGLLVGAATAKDERVSGWLIVAATVYGIVWFTGGLS